MRLAIIASSIIISAAINHKFVYDNHIFFIAMCIIFGLFDFYEEFIEKKDK